MADRRSWLRRWSRRIAALTLMLVALGLASWMSTSQGGTDAFHRLAPELRNGPFEVSGAIGEPVRVRQFQLTVERVDGSSKVTVSSPLAKTTTGSGAVFIVVTAVLQARSETTAISRYVLRDSAGRQFSATDRWNQECVGTKVEPRIPTRVQPVFEVPPDASGLQLLVSAAVDERLDSQAVVPLGPAADELSRWAERTEPVLVARPESLPVTPGIGG
ncbi:DUF4352 domain-containing protein [Nakamurella lactea]|uniref:hypothetical protein n=1 Tax=Nakamurella lactea TaxID=459515 RepID=UPI000423A6CE|nr:hypothetical protein [Nakamurella lactea]